MAMTLLATGSQSPIHEGRVTTTAYDAANEPTSITYSDGKTPNITGISYDADGQRTGQSDGSGTWSWTWDSLHRLTSVTEGNNGTVKYRYDLRDDPTTITYPNGKTVTRSYDAAGRWTSVTDWLGNTTTFSYDPDSNLTTEALPGSTGITDTSTYANDDSLNAISDKHGAKTLFAANYTRDANRQLTGDSSQPESENGYGYTALNQLCYAGATAGSCSSLPSGATAYQYDSADNLVRMGNTTQTFNAADELTGTTTPTQEANKEHEPEGNKHEPTPETKVGPSPGPPVIHNEPQPNIKVLGSHEERVLPAVTSGKMTFVRANGHRGTVSQLVSTSGTNALLLAFVSAKQPHGGGQGVDGIKGGKLSWSPITSAELRGGYVTIWQARARKSLKRTRVSIKLRKAGLPATLTVVGLDSGASVVQGARGSAKSGAIHLATTVPADGAVWAVGQDTLQHTSLQALQGQTVVAKLNGPGSAISWLQSATATSAGRLVLGDSTPKSSSWALAAVTIQERTAVAARITRRSASPRTGPAISGSAPVISKASPSSRASTAQPLTGTENETGTFTYDAEGDRTGSTDSAGTSQTYAYNQALELSGIGKEVSYAYSGDGLRMSKTVNGTKSSFSWDVSAGIPLVLEDGTNTYIYGPSGLPLEQIAGTTPLWFHQDQLGNTRLLTSATGQTVAKYAYTPYGDLSSSSGASSTPMLFAGQYRDNESGLYYLRARYYDPATAQFLSVNPAVAATMSPYAYVAGDPLNSVNPTGLDTNPGLDTLCASNSALIDKAKLLPKTASIAYGVVCGATSAGQLAAGAVCTAVGAAAASVTAGIGFVAGLGCGIFLDYASDAFNNFPTLAQINQALATCQYPQGADNASRVQNAILNDISVRERRIPTETPGTPSYKTDKAKLSQAILFKDFGITGP